VNYCYSK